MLKLCCLLTLAMAAALVAADNDAAIWSHYKIVPDVIGEAPKYRLPVDYPTVSIDLGQTLLPSAATTKPDVYFTADPAKCYTLAMVDPDGGPFNHWLVVNIPGKNGGVIEGGTILADYYPPTPPSGTGFHRYTFLVFEQPGHLTFDEEPIGPGDVLKRKGFQIRDFVNKYSLGSPVFGNFFLAEFQNE